MKAIIITVLITFLSFGVWAQEKSFDLIASTEPIPVSDIKTTHLILNSKIKYLDLGSRYFVTDTVANVVKVKHIGGDFLEKEEEKKTNITIITETGDYYAIPLYFYRDITNTTYKINTSSNKVGAANAIKKKDELMDLCGRAEKAASNYNLKGNRDLVISKITGIYYREKYIAIRLEIKNFSTITLDIDHFLFRYKKNKRIAADAVYQERVLFPIKECNPSKQVSGAGGIETFTFIFNKFTPNEKEDLHVEIIETNGGRSTTIDIPRKKLLTPAVI